MNETGESSWELPGFTATALREKTRDHCLIIPVLNQGQILLDQLDRLQSQLDLVDILLCDGASDDGSTELEGLRRRNVTCLLVTREPGLSTATRMGLSHGLRQGYRGILMMDGNGKDRVSTVADVVRKLEDGYDFVQTSRFKKGGRHENTPLERYLGVRLVISPILSLSSRFYYSDPTNSFTGMSPRYLLDPRVQPFRRVFQHYSLHYHLNRMAPRLGYRVTEIPHVRVYPKEDRGSLTRTANTKIRGLRPRLRIVGELLAAVLGRYDVRR